MTAGQKDSNRFHSDYTSTIVFEVTKHAARLITKAPAKFQNMSQLGKKEDITESRKLEIDDDCDPDEEEKQFALGIVNWAALRLRGGGSKQSEFHPQPD